MALLKTKSPSSLVDDEVPQPEKGDLMVMTKFSSFSSFCATLSVTIKLEVVNVVLESVLSNHFLVKRDTHVRVAAHNLWLGDVTVHARVARAGAVALETIV